MENKILKRSFEIQSRYDAFYTGGKVQLSDDGEYMLCQCKTQVNILQVSTGQQVIQIGDEDDEPVRCFALSPDSQHLVVAALTLLKQWDWKNKLCIRTWQAIHNAPVSCMSFDNTSTLLATGGSDSSIKVWDIVRKYCTHNLTGHRGVVSVAQFHPDIDKLQLYSTAEDCQIRVWDLRKSTCIYVLENHYSVVTSLQFSLENHKLYSAGRDSVVTVWDLNKYVKDKTIPVYESVEGMILLPNEDFSRFGVDRTAPHFLTGGAKGSLKIWNANTSRCVFTCKPETSEREKEENDTSQQAFVAASYNKTINRIMLVTYDQNILFIDMQDLKTDKQFVGYNDDILNIKYFGTSENYIAVATNSENIKIFKTDTWACQILRGHTDTVMCLDVHKSRQLMASGSKDNNLIVWKMNEETKQITRVAIARGHTQTVLSVAFPKKEAKFVVTGSEDSTLKVWMLPTEFTENLITLQSKYIEKAHDKDVNAVCVSPNDKLIATGSADRTAKLWTAPDLALVGVFRGHRRGIWDVQFSPVDQVLATASADAKINIWSISDFSCVKTFEGHESSVLKVHFLSRGMQLLSSGSDGLLKLWTVKSNECVKTYDKHEDKVWALAVNQNEDHIVTGAADSVINIWKDVTEEEQLKQQKDIMDTVVKEQKLANLLHEKRYLKAIGLAITLEQPFKVLNIIKEVLGDLDGKDEMEKTLCRLRDDQLDAVLRYAVRWNMNSKHCHVAQFVISTVLRTFTSDELSQLPTIKSTVQSLLPYTERHFKRMNRLQQSAMFVGYTWFTMNPVAAESTFKPIRDDENAEFISSDTMYYMDDIGRRNESLSDDSSKAATSESDVDHKITAKPDRSRSSVKKRKGSISSSSSENSDEATKKKLVKSTVKKRKDSILSQTTDSSKSKGDAIAKVGNKKKSVLKKPKGSDPIQLTRDDSEGEATKKIVKKMKRTYRSAKDFEKKTLARTLKSSDKENNTVTDSDISPLLKNVKIKKKKVPTATLR